MPRWGVARRTLVGVTAAVVLTGCGGGAAESGSSSTGAQAAPRTITVFAAASLKGPFTQLAHAYEAAHPGVHVALTFAGSSDLVGQLSSGAPGDVLATADESNMTKAVDAGVVAAGAPTPFATNVLTVVTGPANPRRVATFADLGRDGVQVVVCAPQVPCGRATEQLEHATGVHLHPVSEENSVTDVLGKVTSGQADAGVVYVTDALAAQAAVHRVDVPQAAGIVNTYPVAVTRDAASTREAGAFVAYVTGAQGRRALQAAGFGVPS